MPTAEHTPDNFADWLSGRRNELGLSVKQLSVASGITTVQIYNIESGKTANPQVKTREALAKALETPIPPEVISKSEADSSIAGLGNLIDFDPHEDADRPMLPGVYVFYDVAERPLYVGQSRNIRKRVKEYEDKFWFKRPWWKVPRTFK